ncbi:signal peptidase I [Arenivirga flava]|uniref:Signal peptidase I n=1 Tax=Arenivirga flava TaxID=1930060 RepID=A0AA37UMQ8_9MICO|nr:signal peptidase I [Arenivirga flava]GMA29090.1 hypothetical protein GCM10025874_23430 [Arenivirga flava]
MGVYRRGRRRRRALAVLVAARSALLTVAAALGAVCIAVFLVCLVANVRPLIVMSGSMEPDIPVGSVVFSQVVGVGEISVGDVVTVERPRDLGLITHRVVAIAPEADGAVSLTLRGDANDSDDPQPYVVSQAGAYRLHLPWFGYVSAWLRTTSGLLCAAAAVVAFLALYLLDPRRLGARVAGGRPSRPSGRRRRVPVRGG